MWLPWRVKNFIRNNKILMGLCAYFHLDLNLLYDEQFSKGPAMNKSYAKDIASAIYDEFKPKSAIDIGCGVGDILASLKEKGVHVCGVDGSKSNKKYTQIDKDNFILFDLRKGFMSKSKFDICLSLEVAEHINIKYSDRFIDSLTSSSSVIVFSASPPGYGGRDHCNEQPMNFWNEKFNKRGYLLENESTNRLKQKISKIPNAFRCYHENLAVFKANNK